MIVSFLFFSLFAGFFLLVPMRSFILFSLLCLCVFAYHYELPEFPCALTVLLDTDGQYLRLRQAWYANGDLMRYVYAESFSELFDDTVFRSDLSEDVNGTRCVKVFTSSFEHHNMTRLVPPDQAEAMFGLRKHFDMYFDSVTDTSYRGQKCKKYFNDTKYIALYVGSDGFPIGMESANQDHNITFTRKAPLSLFVLNKTIYFDDDRIHTPPKESSCPPDSSSLSSKLSVPFFLVAVVSVVSLLLIY